MSMDQSRRRVLQLGGALSVSAVVTPFAKAAAPSAGAPHVDPTIDSYFGTTVHDPYRWMEAEGPEWRAYVDAKGARTTHILSSIPGRREIVRETSALLDQVTSFGGLQVAGERYFYLLLSPGAASVRLFVRSGESGAPRLLVDPVALKGEHANINWWVASPNGRFVVFGVSKGGTERAVAHIIDVASAALLPEVLEGAMLMAPSWTPDSQSFFYNRLNPSAPLAGPEALKHTSCWRHRLQTPQAQDVRLMGEGVDLAVPFTDTQRPLIIATPGSDVLIGRVRDGISNYVRLYAGSLQALDQGRLRWSEICSADRSVTDVAVLGSDIYLLSTLGAPHGRVLKVTSERPPIDQADVVVPERETILRDMVAARDGLYLRQSHKGRSGLVRLANGSALKDVSIPGGNPVSYVSGNTDHDGVWVTTEGWVQPESLFRVSPEGVARPLGLIPQLSVALDGYVAEEVTYPSHDGTLVPLSIIYRSDLKRDGSAPLLLEAYGAYGASEEPYFDITRLPFLDRGGVYAVAHVRGGGEGGEAWHLAGQKATKPNTWRDDIAAAEYLIAQRYTRSPKLAVVGESAGGITVGRFITERPELAAVAISEAGLLNPLRFEVTGAGPANVPEFGTTKTQQGFEALLAMDAYQHVQDGVAYPSVMLCTGLNDPRVAPWQATKMAARLQAATSSHNPILLRVDPDAGHFGIANDQVVQTWADIVSFIFWRTGQRGFQPQ